MQMRKSLGAIHTHGTCLLLFILFLASGCAGTIVMKEVAREASIRLDTLDEDVVRCRIRLLYDNTGGQIKTAIEQGKKDVKIDPARIPSNPVPVLIGADLDSKGEGGVFRGQKKIGSVNYVCVEPKRSNLFITLQLDEPIYFRYEQLPDMKLPELPCGIWVTGRTLTEADRWGVSDTCTFFLDPTVSRAWPALTPSMIKRPGR